MNRERLPEGWTLEQIQELADYYDHQTDDEAIAEHEVLLHSEEDTRMDVPIELVPVVRALIARHGRRPQAESG